VLQVRDAYRIIMICESYGYALSLDNNSALLLDPLLTSALSFSTRRGPLPTLRIEWIDVPFRA
jgi:hypothetical protein